MNYYRESPTKQLRRFEILNLTLSFAFSTMTIIVTACICRILSKIKVNFIVLVIFSLIEIHQEELGVYNAI